VVVAESEHPHTWNRTTQKLEVAGAQALELSFPKIDMADGYPICVTHDAAGKLPVMTPNKHIENGLMEHTVEFGKYLFATLDDTDPESREKGQQETWLRIPPGWEPAPSQPEVVREVVATHFWGTEVIVFGNGDAFYTLNVEPRSKAGQSSGKDKLQSRGLDVRVECQPHRGNGRVLMRMLRQGTTSQCHATPLLAEEMTAEDRIVVAGSVVYIHGPVSQTARWEPMVCSESHRSNDQMEEEPEADSVWGASEPSLCAGPWTWSLSPSLQVVLVLAPDGSVRLSNSTLASMTVEQLQVAQRIVASCGTSVIGPGAAWIDPAKFSLVKVSGSWDTEKRKHLRVELECADDFGSASLEFRSSGAPSLENEAVVIPGEVIHMRWGQQRVMCDGSSAARTNIGKMEVASGP